MPAPKPLTLDFLDVKYKNLRNEPEYRPINILELKSLNVFKDLDDSTHYSLNDFYENIISKPAVDPWSESGESEDSKSSSSYSETIPKQSLYLF